MRFKFFNELVLIVLLSILLVCVIWIADSAVLRIILGLPFVLFFPGYALIAVLFPGRKVIGGFERLALSLGCSVMVAGLTGLALNYTPWGVGLFPAVIALFAIILILSVIAWLRRRRLPQGDRHVFSFSFNISSWRGQARADRVFSMTLLATLVVAIGVLGYNVLSPGIGERYTEFYVLGLEGKAIDYPYTLEVGQEGTILVGIINREHEITRYRVDMRIGGGENITLSPVVLDNDGKWEDAVVFIPENAGSSQKVELLLYNLNNSEHEVYQQLHFWIDVKDKT